MSKMQNSLRVAVAVLATTLSAAALAQNGGKLYDNSLVPLNRIHSGNYEFGDQVSLSGNAALPFLVTDFSFEYRGENIVADASKLINLKFYAPDGAGSGPGTKLFDYNAEWANVSGLIDIRNGDKTVAIHGNGMSIPVPQTFIWTVSFSGLGAGETAGLIQYGGPEVGTSPDGFWGANGTDGAWAYNTLPSGVANFGAQIVGIPEPTTLQLGLLALVGGLGFLGVRRRA